MAMDEHRLHLATVLVHIVSVIGFITNFIAVLTIIKSNKMHSSFGIICACLAANNAFVLLLNSAWYMLPDSDTFKTGSFASKLIGLALFITGIRFHILISVNRLVSIVSPFQSAKRITNRRTFFATLIVLCATMLQISPFVISEEIWLCYDRHTMRWIFSETETGKLGRLYLVSIPNSFDLSVVMMLDVITLLYLHFSHAKTSPAAEVNAINANTRAAEIRLFKQAFSQSIPLLVTFAAFVFLTPRLEDDFDKFLSTTLIWHFNHLVDGLIIDIFNTRLELFIKRQQAVTTVVPTTSFMPTSVSQAQT